MQRLEVSGALRPIYGSLGVKRLMKHCTMTMYDGVDAQLHVFLVSVLDIGACSVARVGDLKHGQKIPS